MINVIPLPTRTLRRRRASRQPSLLERLRRQSADLVRTGKIQRGTELHKLKVEAANAPLRHKTFYWQGTRFRIHRNFLFDFVADPETGRLLVGWAA